MASVVETVATTSSQESVAPMGAAWMDKQQEANPMAILSSWKRCHRPHGMAFRWSDIEDEVIDSEYPTWDIACSKGKPSDASSSSELSEACKSTDAGSSGSDSEGDSVSSPTNSGRGAKLSQAAATFEHAKTSLMFGNIPCKFNRKKVLAALDEAGLAGRYDTVHVPMHASGQSNKGYCFVNLLTHQDAQWCMWRFYGSSFGNSQSKKTCTVRWASVQGSESMGTLPRV